jgi:flagellar biosynthesis protein FlgN
MINAIPFEQDAKLVLELQSILAREQASLTTIDVDTVEALIEEKAVLLDKLNQVTKERYKTLQIHGFEGSEAGMQSWLKWQGDAELNKAWYQFQRTLVEAKEMNRLNGMLIGRHFARNQQLLNQLHGSVDSGVYGKNGQTALRGLPRNGLHA